MAFSTLPEDSRVAMPFASAGNVGKSPHPIARAARPFCMRSIWSASSGYLLAVGFEELVSNRCRSRRPRCADALLEMLAHAVRHEELGILRPAVAALGQADLLLAERLAVSRAGVLLVRRAVADMAVDDDQGRHIGACFEFLDCLRQAFGVVGIADALHVPAIGEEIAPRRLR